MLSETKLSHLPNPFPIPLAMRDLSSCFDEGSVVLSNSGGGGGGSSTAASFALNRSLQGIHTCFYKSVLTTRKELLIKISWSKTHAAKSVSVSVEDITTAAPPPRPDAMGTDSGGIQLLQKKKGSRSFVTKKSSVISLHWDTSAAKYGLGPEPVKDFYLVVIADAEFTLLLGDMSRDFIINKFVEAIPIAKFSLLSRKEQARGATLYSTRSKFRDGGREHEIQIQLKGDAWESRDSELSVSIDKKRAVQVRRLKWNFRGNQTIFIDGTTVDLMWDLHDWWFRHPLGCVLFMFKTRSALESRLWMDEELARTGQGSAGFFLMIEAFKSQ